MRACPSYVSRTSLASLEDITHFTNAACTCPTLQVQVHEKSFHKQCFRCFKCQCNLTISNFEMDGDGAIFCKIHFAQARFCPLLLAERSLSSFWMSTRLPQLMTLTGGLRAGASQSELAGSSAHPGSSSDIGDATFVSTQEAASRRSTNLTSRANGLHTKVQGDVCERCTKRVYATEKAVARRSMGPLRIFHKACFRCADCDTKLRPENWELDDDNALVCQVHYNDRQLRRMSCEAVN